MPLSRENLNCRFVAVARATEVYSGPITILMYVQECSIIALFCCNFNQQTTTVKLPGGRTYARVVPGSHSEIKCNLTAIKFEQWSFYLNMLKINLARIIQPCLHRETHRLLQIGKDPFGKFDRKKLYSIYSFVKKFFHINKINNLAIENRY